MNEPTVAIAEATSALRDAWARSLGGAPMGRGVHDDIDAMSDAGMLAVNDALATLRRTVDALHARVAAGIAARSTPEQGREGLARRAGFRSPQRLIAAATGAHAGDAQRLMQVGAATAPRMTFSGQRAPARHPELADALAAGTVSVAAASAIAAMLDRVALRAGAAALREAEASIVAQAPLLSLDELCAVLRRAEAWLDPDGLEPKLDELHTARSLHLREDRDGMLVLTAKLDPETAAPIRAAIGAIVSTQLRASRGTHRPGAIVAEAAPDAAADATAASARDAAAEVAPVEVETRTLPQLQADALATLCRHSLACENAAPGLAVTTVVVRIPLDALVSGTGTATIDGMAQPIDAATARRMAADAEVIPCVLGGDSEILDFGRARRLFSRAQKLALVERDGGCAFCGLPPQFAEGHHLRWWDRDHGGTDLGNAVLLCTGCHHRVHADGWEIRIDPPPSGDATGGSVWFVPPRHLDPAQTPRLGGRRRFDFSLVA